MTMQQQSVPQARKKSHAELQRFINERMSCNYVEVPASIFEEQDDPETIKKLAAAWR